MTTDKNTTDKTAAEPVTTKETTHHTIQLTKANLAVVAAASTDETRTLLTGLHVMPDGSTVATDGRWLLACSPCLQDGFECAPDSPGSAPPVTIPLHAVNHIKKLIPRNMVEIDQAALEIDTAINTKTFPVPPDADPAAEPNISTSTEHSLTLSTCQLKHNIKHAITVPAIENTSFSREYPHWQQVMPPPAAPANMVNVVLSIDFLEAMLKAAKSAGLDRDHRDITMEINLTQLSPARSAASPIITRFRLSNQQDLFGIIMPKRSFNDGDNIGPGPMETALRREREKQLKQQWADEQAARKDGDQS